MKDSIKQQCLQKKVFYFLKYYEIYFKLSFKAESRLIKRLRTFRVNNLDFLRLLRNVPYFVLLYAHSALNYHRQNHLL